MPATRYEILLPLKYNDGRDVEVDKLLKTKRELVERFGALTVNPHPVEGLWTHAGKAFEDELLKFLVDVEEDTAEAQRFFQDFKEVLKRRFDQIDIWIVAFPIRLV